jgi:hypothetical protein
MGVSNRGLCALNLDMSLFLSRDLGSSKRISDYRLFILEMSREKEFLQELKSLIESRYPNLLPISEAEEKELGSFVYRGHSDAKDSLYMPAHLVDKFCQKDLKVMVSQACDFLPFKELSRDFKSIEINLEDQYSSAGNLALSLVAKTTCPGYRIKKTTVTVDNLVYHGEQKVHLPDPVSVTIRRGLLYRHSMCHRLSDAYLYVPGQLESNFPKRRS